MSIENSAGENARATAAAFSILVVTLAVFGALFAYKWSAAYRAVIKTQSAGVYQPRAEVIPTSGLPLLMEGGARTFNYLAAVWPALVFGVLIAGLVRAFVSPKEVARLLGSGLARQQIAGGVAAMPLMLCSCCIAPVFSSVRARGAGLGPSLAIMLGSPSLNVAALALTFLLFPIGVALARVGLAVFAVFLMPLIVERWTAGATAPPAADRESELPAAGGIPAVIGLWLKSAAAVAASTIPLILLGVFASSLIGRWAAHPGAGHPGAHQAIAGWSIVVIALGATLVAFPTFLEIPFALMLGASGFPQGAVVAVLFAGPAINLPSLFTLARVSSKRVALLVFLGVWITATLAGLSFQA